VDQTRSLRVAGLLASITALALLWVASSVTRLVPFPPTAAAARIVRLTPGDLATFFIESLGHWALRLLSLGALAAALVIGAEALVLTASPSRIRPGLAAAILGLVAAVAAFLDPTLQPDPIYVLVATLIACGLYAAVARAVYRRLAGEHQGADLVRRQTIRLGLMGGVALAALGGGAGWLIRRLGGPDTNVSLALPLNPAEVPVRAEWPEIGGITPEVTSVPDHYEVDINLLPPTVEADSWTLNVSGGVEDPLELSFGELQERYEIVEEYATLTCVSNEIGGELVGHSRWGGVRLTDVLAAARPRPGGQDVVLRAADGYSDSIPLVVADDPRVIIALSQNGRPLTREHGFPCRLRVPPIYGMKNVKWLQSIEISPSDYKGYWQKRGWSDEALVKTQSRIDVAGDGLTARIARPTWVAGVAWAGDRGIERVEVSLDAGTTWKQARVREPLGPVSWVQWAYRWTPEDARTVTIACRATDGHGEVQTARLAQPHPDGASGYHEVAVSVT
jgi:DMSO/TMAO reductase YedYZ molybdopterin-dependent catalytic subunit